MIIMSIRGKFHCKQTRDQLLNLLLNEVLKHNPKYKECSMPSLNLNLNKVLQQQTMNLFNKYFHNILSLLLICCFAMTCYDSWSKFVQKSVSVSFSEKKTPKIPYPSVTICPSSATKSKVHSTMFNSNISFEEMRSIYTSNVWNRNETIFFLNHKTGPDIGFPCMTSSEDLFDPGKPCAFPFVLSNFNNMR